MAQAGAAQVPAAFDFLAGRAGEPLPPPGKVFPGHQVPATQAQGHVRRIAHVAADAAAHLPAVQALQVQLGVADRLCGGHAGQHNRLELAGIIQRHVHRGHDHTPVGQFRHPVQEVHAALPAAKRRPGGFPIPAQRSDQSHAGDGHGIVRRGRQAAGDRRVAHRYLGKLRAARQACQRRRRNRRRRTLPYPKIDSRGKARKRSRWPF